MRAKESDEVNDDGMFDRQHAIENPEDLKRIACLGDSVTYGYGVPAAESFPVMLGARLNREAKRAEVFKIAMPGWSTLQELIAYQRIARKYKPELVLVGFCLNDVAEMQNNMAPPQLMSRIEGLAYRHSNLFRWILRPQAREIYAAEELFSRPGARNVASGWDLTLKAMGGIVKEAREDGCRVVILIFPFRLQVEPDAPAPIPQEKLAKWCIENQVDYIDLLPALKRTGTAGYIDYDHLSKTGAEAVVEALLQSPLLRDFQ
ncbi:SGNH/GDSL hydrolase family protein [Candidatus Sumerlaeota bacterium]|nr:SGNH/GDSL hydrolase family protein [Candidatus Sumerlaeota bacterium]MBI3737378.1 SGNH/GDSL hydrolase family protein [Candidatus Sumerlaeota bacterium]